MTLLAPTLQTFFTDRLLTQRQVSPRTIAAYRDTLRLLLGFVLERAGKMPAQLDLADVDADTVGSFLNWLERHRHNSVRTRNARLAAVHSLFRYASLRHPEHADVIQRVLAIPSKRFNRTSIDFLNQEEVDALLAAPDRTTWTGRRDHALLVLAIQTGLRVTELTGLHLGDLELGVGAHVRCRGKGRKRRATPLRPHTVAVLRAWLQERGGDSADAVFPNLQGGTLSPDSVQWLVAKHTAAAAKHCSSIRSKRVTPHVLRHSCAMNLLQNGVDLSVIALWLGHESIRSTQLYLHADMALKEKALARTQPPNTKAGRFRAPDALLAFLEAL